MFRSIYIVVALTILNASATGQSDSTQSTAGSDLSMYLPPLQLLIDSAVANSPRLAHYDAIVESYEYNLSATRNRWTDQIMVGGSYNYGNQGQAANTLFLGNQLTVGVSIPLGTIINRRNNIRIAKAQLEAEEMTYQSALLEVQEEVIETYNDLLLFQRLIGIQAEAMQSAQLAMEMAEERFRRGELTMDQLGTYIELQAKYKTSYETMRTEFSNTYYKLERIVGIPLSAFEQ